MSIKSSFPDGHYASPNLCLKDIEYANKIRDAEINLPNLPGIDLRAKEQLDLAERLSLAYSSGPVKFPISKTPEYRFHFQNDAFSYADAITLSAMIQHFRPKRLIEVGSGYSSCVTLDTVEKAGVDCECVFIEPYADSLRRLVRVEDRGRIKLIEKNLQEVELEVFKGLKEGDILFVDSSHVMKIGSDVSYLLHQVLPCLARGVLVHFHDIFWPFAYPDRWTMGGIAWNEQLGIRCFLEFNEGFRVEYFTGYLWHHYGEEMKGWFKEGVRNVGGGLYLRRV